MHEQILRPNTIAAPKLIAHRGFAVHAPQNSLPAFEEAGKLGFWAIETDVRKTADGQLVCCHDGTVDSMFCGSGEIWQMTLGQLQSLSFREEKSKGCSEPGRMPLFREYLAICKRYGCIPFIETKTTDIAEVLEAVGEFFREDEFVMSSVQFSHLEQVRKITDQVFIHHIFSDAEKMCLLSQMGNSGLSYNYPVYQDMPSELLEKTHAAGVKLCLRAGDSAQAVRDMIQMGLDYIPTNCISEI